MARYSLIWLLAGSGWLLAVPAGFVLDNGREWKLGVAFGGFWMIEYVTHWVIMRWLLRRRSARVISGRRA